MRNKRKLRTLTTQFDEITSLIEKARSTALRTVNTELIRLYWKIGEYMSRKLSNSEWGESVVSELALHIQKNYPQYKGYSDKNLWRMRQFYETYREIQKLSPVVRQLSWSNHLLILSKTKSIEEKEFYIRLSIKERYSKRELERQIDSGIFERRVVSNKKASPVMKQLHKNLAGTFKDTYILDFLDLPKNYSEKDLQTALVENFKHFVLEFGRDFAFLGKEYRLQVGRSDFFVDLLFFHRELRCLVAFELKIDDFKPEYLGKMNFYLEALDKDIKKSYENPSVGIILCKSKDKEVVEYALRRNMSPALVSEYKTKLISKRLLQQKMHEFFAIGEG